MSLSFDNVQFPIRENLLKLKEELPEGVKLVAVSKTHPPDVIMQAYQASHRVFGENKIQELTAKQEELPGDIEWHMIGHMQSNKVKYCAPFVDLIHSVDSLKLMNVIQREAEKNDRTIPVLLQMHIAEEDSKFGLSREELLALLNHQNRSQWTRVRLSGLMGMATFTPEQEQVSREFRFLRKLFDEVKRDYFANDPQFKELSMGMSGDYRLAVDEGSTILRIGSLIFGSRNYT